MTETHTGEQTADGVDRSLGPHLMRRAITSDLIRLGKLNGPRTGVSAAAVASGYEKTWRITDRWLPLARQRSQAASGSAADRARWDGLIKAAARAAEQVGRPSSVEWVELAAHTRELLRALRDTEPSYVPVVEVAARIAEAIKDGTYLPGASLSPARIAAELRLPPDSARLALTDLAGENLVELSATGRARVSAPGLADRFQQIADCLRDLIAAGVYPSGTHLPVRSVLARNLVTAEPPIAAAIRLLIEDGTLICYPGQRPIVRPGHPDAGAQAAERARAFAQLPHPTGPVDLSDAGIREAVRVTQSWWKARLAPHPATLDHYLTWLVAIARHLITQARTPQTRTRAPAHGGCQEHPESQEGREPLDSVIARITAGATGAARAEPEHRVWRTAYLAAAVLDLLKLTSAETGDAR
ncbi:GntR family transcriptional regulator [Streptomyces sp. ISID311]|uniref:GntR family transcriptional regulator n=1 Tax=Streptomyces sp. ISID311 TaxID=2601673 RepID=UPI00164B80F4|nr:GntR family transcriptional regulator [Streptomyces sp. ISID311]